MTAYEVGVDVSKWQAPERMNWRKLRDEAGYWNCVEITQAQALTLAGPTATLIADGHFIFPQPSV